MADNWTGGDAAHLRAFMEKCPNFIAELRSRGPKISKEAKTEERAMTGSEVKAMEDIFVLIEDMASQKADSKTNRTGFVAE